MKKVFFISLLSIQCLNLQSQTLNWVNPTGGSGSDFGNSITVDSLGNVYNVGEFQNSSDFDSGDEIYYMSSAGNFDAFITKTNSQGDLIWAKRIGGINYDSGNGITIDDSGYVYVTGAFNGVVDFNPGAGIYNVNGGSGSTFLLKLNSYGNFIWVKSFNAIGFSSYSHGLSIAFDLFNNIIISGELNGGADMDPGVGSHSLFSSGDEDVYVCKLNYQGDFIWAVKIGGGGIERAGYVTTNSMGDIFVSGAFEGTADFDPGVGVYNLVAIGSGWLDGFFMKLDSSGNFQWANKIGDAYDDYTNSIALDTNENVIVSGSFDGTVDFDPGPSTFALSTTPYYNGYVAKYTTNGDFIWAKSLESTASSSVSTVIIDENNDIYLTGTYNGITDFDPGIGVVPLTTSASAGGGFILKLDETGNFMWVEKISGFHSFIGKKMAIDYKRNIFTTGDFSFTTNFEEQSNNFNFTSSGSYDFFILKLIQRGVVGKIYLDISNDCNYDTTETGLSTRRAIINPGNIIVETNDAGVWYLDSLPSGSYTITVDTSGNWEATCSISQNFTVINPYDLTLAPNFGMINNHPCSAPNISVIMPFMRDCFTNQRIYVQARNSETATDILSASYVNIELDTLIQVTSASTAYTDLGNNIFQFYTGSLYPGENENFWLEATVSCDARIGQTLCMQANIFPADSCIFDTVPNPNEGGVLPCLLPWDNSSIEVTSNCDNDSIYFTIANIGNGDMQCYSPMRIYQDAQLILQDSFLLMQGEVDTLIFTGDGRTWRLEADQHPLHPGNSHPNTTIELCGPDSNWTMGLVNIFPMNDADPNVSIYCDEVSASYDPNDKTGYPLGITDTHFVEPNLKMEYVIRFQNTGTDTAFTIVVRDTLEMDFNIFSTLSGASSNNYNFTMHGPRVLEWTFNNILLPPAIIDEPGSHGFVSFTVEQNPDLAPGTELNNEVGIYFDYNPPIITNKTSHVIRIPSSVPDFSGNGYYSETTCEEISFNGILYENSGEYYQIINDSLFQLDLTINQIDVDVIQNNLTLTATSSGSTYQWLDCNNGFSTILNATNQSFTPLVNGSYAVSVTENGCTDTSSCFTISTIGVSENSFGENIRIYPNPSTGKLFIDLGMKTDKMNVSVKNAIGQIIYSESYQNKNILELNLNVERGIYFVELMSEEGSKKVFKFIVE